jgi:hypothetical protein
MSAAPTGTEVIHRTREGKITSGVVAGGGVLTLLFGLSQTAGARWFAFLLAVLMFIAAARTRRSGVRVDDEGVTVMNVARDIRVSWSDVDHVEVSDDGPFSAMVAVVPRMAGSSPIGEGGSRWTA